MLEAVSRPLPVTGWLPDVRIQILSWHTLKLTVAVLVTCAGAYGMLSEKAHVASSDAVISAYIVELRSPIEGMVSGVSRRGGEMVHQGEALAHIEDQLPNREHLDHFQMADALAQSSAEADAVEAATLESQRRILLSRSRANIHAIASRLALALSEAESVSQSREAAAGEAKIELERGRELHAAGILSTASFDKLVATEAIARNDAASQRASLESYRSQTNAARAGIINEPGANSDVTYSQQRADEIAIRLAEVHRSLAAARAQANEAHTLVLAETARDAQLRQARLVAPLSGAVWEVRAMDGERVSAGDPVLSIVDCDAQFLLAEVPQDELSDIKIGGRATFKLAGESAERSGTVISVTGDSQKDSNRKFAAFPVQHPAQNLATVRVQVNSPSSESACTVGRSAQVLLPTRGSNLATRWLREIF